MPKDGTWKPLGTGEFESKLKEFAKAGGQNWKVMSGEIAELVARQIAESRARKSQEKAKAKARKKADKKKKK